MKQKLFILLVCLLCITYGYSQSGFRTVTSSGLTTADEVSTNQVSINNAWFGSSFNYKLTGDANFNDNFLFNANILYNPSVGLEGWNFPIVGDISLPVAGGSFDEFEIGIYPWSVISQRPNGLSIVVHGGVSYGVVPQTEVGLSPQKLRVLAGAEVSVPLGNNKLPLTISVTPTYESFNLDVGNTFGVEGTFIVPIAPNLGVIGELYAPFKDGFKTEFSAGVLVNGAIGG